MTEQEEEVKQLIKILSEKNSKVIYLQEEIGRLKQRALDQAAYVEFLLGERDRLRQQVKPSTVGIINAIPGSQS